MCSVMSIYCDKLAYAQVVTCYATALCQIQQFASEIAVTRKALPKATFCLEWLKLVSYCQTVSKNSQINYLL